MKDPAEFFDSSIAWWETPLGAARPPSGLAINRSAFTVAWRHLAKALLVARWPGITAGVRTWDTAWPIDRTDHSNAGR